MSQKKRRSPLNEKTKKALRAKAEGTRFTYGELAAVYRKGEYIDIKAVQKSRVNQDVTKKKKKSTKRKNKKSTKS